MTKRQVEIHVLNIWSAIGIDIPSNHEEILDYIFEDVKSCADPKEWHSGDVAIALRRWIEEDR